MTKRNIRGWHILVLLKRHVTEEISSMCSRQIYVLHRLPFREKAMISTHMIDSCVFFILDQYYDALKSVCH